jgi:hypothetical protein
VSNARILTRVAALPRSAQTIAVLAVVLAGFFLPGKAGALALAALAALLVWLLSLTWAVSPPALRLARLVVITALLAYALVKAFA